MAVKKSIFCGRSKKVSVSKNLSWIGVLIVSCLWFESVHSLGPDSPCADYPTSDMCSGVCVWDCQRDQCRDPTCSDYADNVSCPAGCLWECFSQTCQSHDTWDELKTFKQINRALEHK